MSDSVSLILDTDIGDDVDDAFALAQAALHPSIDLVAITTCWGDTAARARLARRVLDAAGGDRVPIHPGPDTSFGSGRYGCNGDDVRPGLHPIRSRSSNPGCG